MAAVCRRWRQIHRQWAPVTLRLISGTGAPSWSVLSRFSSAKAVIIDGDANEIFARERVALVKFRGLVAIMANSSVDDTNIVNLAGISKVNLSESQNTSAAGIAVLLQHGLTHLAMSAHWGCFENRFVNDEMMLTIGTHGQNLIELDISGCINVSVLNPLKLLTNLVRMDIGSCFRLDFHSVLDMLSSLESLEYLACGPDHVKSFYEMMRAAPRLRGLLINGTVSPDAAARMFESYQPEPRLELLSFIYSGNSAVLLLAAGTRILHFYDGDIPRSTFASLVDSGTEVLLCRNPQTDLIRPECFSIFDDVAIRRFLPRFESQHPKFS